MKNRKAKKGFTIIELVIVIAVIGILAGVLIPTFSNVIANANKTAAMENAKNAYTNYLIDHATDAAVVKTFALKAMVTTSRSLMVNLMQLHMKHNLLIWLQVPCTGLLMAQNLNSMVKTSLHTHTNKSDTPQGI